MSKRDGLQRIGEPKEPAEMAMSQNSGEFLFEENMVSVDTKLDDAFLSRVARHNDDLVKLSNIRMYEIEKRTQYKKRLEATLRNMQKTNAVESSPVEEAYDLEADCYSWENKLLFAEVDTRVYEAMLRKLKGCLYAVREKAEAARSELNKAEYLFGQTKKADDEADGIKRKEEERTVQADSDESGAAELKRKIDAGRKYCETLARDIATVRQRLQNKDEGQKYQSLKEQRIQASIRKLKERKGLYGQVMGKLKAYYAEFQKQYANLVNIFKANKKDEIMEKKECRDIQLQSERIGYNAKIHQLQQCKDFYCRLNEELASLRAGTNKNKTAIEAQRMYDMGEYNPDAMSSKYVDQRMNLQKVTRDLEEQLDFARTVVSCIKHVLLKLQKGDKDNETGTWYNLSSVAGIDEISTSEIRPKFSKLLMILEQKIVCTCTMFLEKVSYMDACDNEPVATSEDLVDRAPLKEVYVSYGGVEACRETLMKRVESCDIIGHAMDADRKSTTVAMRDKQGLVGGMIPTLTSPGRRQHMNSTNIDLIEEPVAEKTKGHGVIRTESMMGETTPYSVRDVDIMGINKNISEILFAHSRHTQPNSKPGTAASENKIMETELKEQAALNAKFNKGRMKVKYDKEIKKHGPGAEEAATPKYQQLSLRSVPGATSQPKAAPTANKSAGMRKKHGCSNVAFEVAKALRDRPQEVVEVAKATFDALEKYKKALESRQKKDPEARLMPNFLNVILHMKKSRGSESLGQIAAKCTFFPMDRSTVSTATPTASTPLSPAISPNSRGGTASQPWKRNGRRLVSTAGQSMRSGNYMQAFSSRLQNIKSLNQLDKMQPSYITAFDRYYKDSALGEAAAKPSTAAASSKHRPSKSMMTTTMQKGSRNVNRTVFPVVGKNERGVSCLPSPVSRFSLYGTQSSVPTAATNTAQKARTQKSAFGKTKTASSGTIRRGKDGAIIF